MSGKNNVHKIPTKIPLQGIPTYLCNKQGLTCSLIHTVGGMSSGCQERQLTHPIFMLFITAMAKIWFQAHFFNVKVIGTWNFECHNILKRCGWKKIQPFWLHYDQTTQREGLCIKRKTHFPSPPKNHTSAAAVCREEKRNCYSFSFLTLSDSMSLPALCVVLNQQQQSGA